MAAAASFGVSVQNGRGADSTPLAQSHAVPDHGVGSHHRSCSNHRAGVHDCGVVYLGRAIFEPDQEVGLGHDLVVRLGDTMDDSFLCRSFPDDDLEIELIAR